MKILEIHGIVLLKITNNILIIFIIESIIKKYLGCIKCTSVV